MAGPAPTRLLVTASQGPGSGDEARVLELTADLEREVWAFDPSHKLRSALRLLRRLLRAPPRLVVVEGTGLGVCLPALVAGVARGVPLVVSSGDAIGPFYRLHGRIAGLVGAGYERLLCRRVAGFVGWTPYLAGRALTLGAPRAMTAANWADHGYDADDRRRVRAELGIPTDAVVFGLVGALRWSPARSYAYGLELVRAIAAVERPDVRVLIVGDGDGLERLRAAAGGDPRVLFPGRVDRAAVPGLLAAMDVASLPQSRDGVGAFRYTTKLSEYLASGLPVLTGRLPFAYDLPAPSIRRLPGLAPWDDVYVGALSAAMESATTTERRGPQAAVDAFDRAAQRARATAFLTELLDERP